MTLLSTLAAAVLATIAAFKADHWLTWLAAGIWICLAGFRVAKYRKSPHVR
jgi:hypothetical protein